MSDSFGSNGDGSRSNDEDKVRVVPREEIDLREKASTPSQRRPWASMKRLTSDESGERHDDVVARFPSSTPTSRTTPFLRPLRSVSTVDDLDEIDLRDVPSDDAPSEESHPSAQTRVATAPTQRHEGSSSRTTSASLPHWTEPATGEVPHVFAELSDDALDPSAEWSLDDLNDATGLSHDAATAEPTMQTQDDVSSTGSEAGVGESDKKAENGESGENGAHSEHSARRWFAKHARRSQGEAVATEVPISEHVAPTAEQFQKSSLMTRVLTGMITAALAVVAFINGPTWVLVLALVVTVGAAIEFFDATRSAGFRPATALGLLGVTGLVAGAYARGEVAIPVVLSLTLIFSFLWFIAGVGKASPTANVAVTMLGVMWVGLCGAFAALLLRAPNNWGVPILAAVALVVAAYDTAAYIGGTIMGRRKLAPHVSPGKTVEGLVIASAVAVAVGLIIVPFFNPWSIAQGLALGVLVAVMAPIGDLAESVIKRDLGLKDMGRILPGHGGILDRFDAFLLMLPVTYYLVITLDMLG